MARNKRRPHTYQYCPNCGNAVTSADHFCSLCGQSTHDLNVPFKHLLEDVMEGLFHFDGKSVQTLKTLLLKPGQLTLDFIRGKRMRYVAPLRFYIFISVVFFFILSTPKVSRTEEPVKETDTTGISVSYWGIQSSELKGVKPSQIDSVLARHDIELTMLNRYIGKQMIRMQTTDRKEFLHTVFKGISYMMFVLMPVFGWFIFFLHRKSAGQYIRSLAFSVHYHSFMFLLLSVLMLVSRSDYFSWAPLLVVVLCPLYLIAALRRVYGGSRWAVFVKTIALGIFQFVALAILFVATVIMSLLLF
jgi:hypothetical protein